MCGIVGYTGKENAVSRALSGLRALEYRGYDSAGIAVQAPGRLKRVRSVGKVSALEAALDKARLAGVCAVAHTRWATHGKPTEKNCHPHTDCTGNVAVVHNGIIENYLTLRAELAKKGHRFSSDTDTEVSAHLIEEYLKTAKGLPEEKLLFAVQKAASVLKGAYALGVVWAGAPGCLAALKRQSPLVVGLSDKGNFLASDVSAFLEYTKKAVFLEDGETALLKPESVSVYDAKGKIIKPKITEISWTQGVAEKGGYEHFMLKEIHEQPSTVNATLSFDKNNPAAVFGLSAAKAKKIKHIQIIACGTAYHAGLSGKYFIEKLAGVPVSVDAASEYKYKYNPRVPGTLVIAVSQSGETADTIAALKKAKEQKYASLAICNVQGSALTRTADHTFYTVAGREMSVASTKAYTAQLSALYAYALYLGRLNGHIKETEFKKALKELLSLPALLRAALKAEKDVKAFARKTHKQNTFIFLGRDAAYPLALEGALKLKEISYLHAEGFPAGEIKHGPIALVERDVPVLISMPSGALFDKLLSAVAETTARGARVIALTDAKGRKKLAGSGVDIIEMPEAGPFISVILHAVAYQLFAYYTANFLGREIDRPRNLAKSVTVE